MSPAPPDELRRLVDQFAQRDPTSLNEEETRVYFINPLFKLLGWPMDSLERGREVRHEDRVRVRGEGLKAPDYGFYLGNKLQFFVEAKRPSVDISRDPRAAFQVRRYAWCGGRPVSVLTDFEEFAVFDCRAEPRLEDRPDDWRLYYYRYDEYALKWGEIAGLFSRQAVLEGSLRALAAEEHRGHTPVDRAFLRELVKWRSQLADDIHLCNPDLPVEELRYAVQQTLNRVVFLRIAEDRGAEDYGRLLKVAGDAGTYRQLCRLFRAADARYDSGLFHFRTEPGESTSPDTFTLDLDLSDEVVARIIRDLYYPRPYEFSVLPTEILGRAYEQFLGSEVELDAGRVEVCEKPEVRKAGGVYYTPAEIVDYIVGITLGPLVEGKSRRQVANLRILDPACGSGSFLIGAYRFLMAWHLDSYTAEGVENHLTDRNAPLYRTAAGDVRLTLAEKKRILRTTLFGVDVDLQAVEVSKLSLLLCVLEDETEQVRQAALFHERALPDLGANIRCGDSLVDTQFDWRQEFPEVFTRARPGFDAVIGNPPYVDSEWMSVHRAALRQWCAEHYEAASGNWDLFCVFAERSLQLLRDGGLHAFIVPNKIGSAPYAAAVRRLLVAANTLLSIRDYSSVPVFPVAVYPVVYCAQRKKHGPRSRRKTVLYERVRDGESGWEVEVALDHLYASHFAADGRPWPIFGTGVGGAALLARLADLPTLGARADVLGAATVKEAYELPPLIESNSTPGDGDLRIINSGTIDRYHPLWASKPMRYIKHTYAFPVIPRDRQGELPKKRREQARTPKAIVAGMTRVLECVADEEGAILAAKSTSIVIPRGGLRVSFLAALLNSSLMTFLFRTQFGGLSLAGGYLRVGPPQLRELPIVVPTTAREVALARDLVRLSREMGDTMRRFDSTRVPGRREELSQEARSLAARIDEMVCSLYGLTAAERELLARPAH